MLNEKKKKERKEEKEKIFLFLVLCLTEGTNNKWVPIRRVEFPTDKMLDRDRSCSLAANDEFCESSFARDVYRREFGDLSRRKIAKRRWFAKRHSLGNNGREIHGKRYEFNFAGRTRASGLVSMVESSRHRDNERY